MKIGKLLLVPLLAGAVNVARGADYVVCDFENYEIGDKLTLWNPWGQESASKATVEADPQNSKNKVLHVVVKNWNDFVEFKLPEEYAGENFAARVEKLSVRIRRHQNDPSGEWKNFEIHLGDELLYHESFPSYGAVSTWKTWKYDVPLVSDDNKSDMLRIGFNSDNTDYYIDDVKLSGTDYPVFEDGVLNFSDPNSTDKSYTSYDQGIMIPAGTELNVYTSRYTYWMSTIKGSGRLNIYSGGERSFLGTKSGASYPDWSKFGGDVHIYPWPEVNTEVKAGFYGQVLGHGNTKFDPGNVKRSIREGSFTSFLANNKVVLHEGATMAGEDGNNARAHRIGSLRMEPGSSLMGYYKGNKQKGVYYIVGGDNADSELAGTIAASGTSLVGIVKEGNGIYSITGNENHITGMVTVVGGKVLISNDALTAKEGKLPGAVGVGENTIGVMVYKGGCVGGSGNISAMTDIYGYLEPGDSKGNVLSIADYQNDNPVDLKLHPTSRLIFNISGSDNAARLDVSGLINYNNRDEVYDKSGAMPILEIKLGENADLKEGDSFTLITAAGKTSDEVADWNFRVQYPQAYTWEVKEQVTDEGYSVIATVVSTDYSGQGDTVITDEIILDGDSNDSFIVDWSDIYDDPTSMRQYAAKGDKYIGVAVATYIMNLNSSTDKKTKAVKDDFNILVAENEMKIDATEPSKGNFSLGGANTIIDFAEKNGMDVRGHTLVWHQQVPGWISSDGKKNNHNWTKDQLLEIMRNHINGVAGKLKGKVREWDVVNECLDDDQSIVWSNPSGYKLRSSVWKDVIGEEFLEQAFRMAHEADPDAELYLNDYSVEFIGDSKAEALYNLVKKLVEKGVPIHGVGLQCHLTTGQLNARRLKENIHRYQDLGLKCIVTELDIAQGNPGAADAARRQAEDYCAAVMAALSEENCPTVMVWGLCDNNSWRENNPLLFDSNVKPKEAYYAVKGALRALANRSDVEDLQSESLDSEIVSVEYFNLQGLKIAADAKGLVLKRITYSNGESRVIKEFVR